MKMIPGPRGSQPPIPASTAEITLSYEDHLGLQAEIMNTASDLSLLQLPNRFSTHLTGITIDPNMPYGLRSRLGDRYYHMSFVSERELVEDEHEAAMSIWLHGNTREQQVRLVTQPGEAETGSERIFNVIPYGSVRATSQIEFSDLSLALDFLMPKSKGAFTTLGDKRQGFTFGEIALRTSEILAPHARNRKTEQMYLAKDYAMSQIECPTRADNTDILAGDFVMEFGSRLVVENEGRTRRYRLSATAPLDFAAGTRITEHFQYSFERKGMQALGGMALLSLLSSDVQPATLQRYVQREVVNFDSSYIGQRALSLLLSELITV